MAGSDAGKRDRTASRSAWKRFGRLMYEWLILLSCLSGNAFFRIDAYEDRAPSTGRPRLDLQPQATRRTNVEPPDLHTQYEDLLDTVWRCERRERLFDRIEAQMRFERALRNDAGGQPAD